MKWIVTRRANVCGSCVRRIPRRAWALSSSSRVRGFVRRLVVCVRCAGRLYGEFPPVGHERDGKAEALGSDE